MPQFNYIARTQNGARREGTIEATNINEASEKLRNDQLIIIKINERDSSFDFIGPFLERLSLSIEKIKNAITKYTVEKIVV